MIGIASLYACQTTPLMTAVWADDNPQIERLLAEGADPKQMAYQSALGASMDPLNLYKQPPLNIAAYHGNVRAMKALIAKGADVNARGTGNYAPLDLALVSNSEAAVRLLLENGVPITRETAEGVARNLNLSSAVKILIANAYRRQNGEETTETTPSPEIPTAPMTVPSASATSDIDSPHHRSPEHPDDFAVVVGVEKYSNELPEAQFAEHDAAAVKAHLLALGYPERNIKYLVGSHASLSNIEAYVEDWLPRNVKAEGQVFFYFSGHGAPAPETGQAFLVPWDGNPNFLDKTAYPLQKLYASLGSLKAHRVIVALDSCFSGAGGRSVLAEGTRPLVTKVSMAPTRDSKLLVYAAASPNEVTSTFKEQGHGTFTYFFLKGLDGGAQAQDGTVSARGLFDYLKPRVQDAANRQNRDQTPVLIGDLETVVRSPR